MASHQHFKQHLQQAYKDYMRLDDDGQTAALDLLAVLLQKMLRDGSGRKQRLSELSNTANACTEMRTNTAKARTKLIRKTNTQSPQSPLKPVQTTSKNELRRT